MYRIPIEIFLSTFLFFLPLVPAIEKFVTAAACVSGRPFYVVVVIHEVCWRQLERKGGFCFFGRILNAAEFWAVLVQYAVVRYSVRCTGVPVPYR